MPSRGDKRRSNTNAVIAAKRIRPLGCSTEDRPFELSPPEVPVEIEIMPLAEQQREIRPVALAKFCDGSIAAEA